MKRFILFFLPVAVAAVLCGCEKEAASAGEGVEIAFHINGGIDFSVLTKASEVTSLSSIYWEACQDGVVIHPVSSYPVEGGGVSTGKYWPLGAVYDYMVSNVPFFTGTGVIAASNDIDVVVGTMPGVRDNSCNVDMKHIFARTSSLTLDTQAGYEISEIVWKIKSKGEESGTAGHYTIGSGWAANSTAPLEEREFSGTSDLYLIPGTYTVTVSYTLTKGDYRESFTRSADISLYEGCLNSIKGSAVGGNAVGLSLSVTVEPWGANDITLDLN